MPERGQFQKFQDLPPHLCRIWVPGFAEMAKLLSGHKMCMHLCVKEREKERGRIGSNWRRLSYFC